MRSYLASAAALCLFGSPLSPVAAQNQAGPPPLDLKAVALTAEVFTAIRNGDRAALVVALDHGADPNRPNWIELTPLDWATMLDRRDLAALLVSRGAKLNQGIYGSPMIGALLVGHEDQALALLEKGAAATAKRPDGATALMLAAAFGSPRVIERLKPDAASLAQQDADGATALIYAARLGQVATARALLDRGAPVDGADRHGRTPLMYAAMNGARGLVDLLLSHGAKANQTDHEKASALHLTARYSGDPAIAASLVKAKAPVDQKDANGKTPRALALARGYTGLVTLLTAAGAPAEPAAALPTAPVAVQRSLVALQGGMKRFLAQSECGSCHHQGLGLAVLGRARLKGFAVDSGIVEANLKRVADGLQQISPLAELAMHEPAMAGVVPTSEMQEFSVASAYLFWALEENQVKATPALTTLAQYTAAQQQATGDWPFTLRRGPMQGSPQTITAFQLLGLRRYLPTGERAPELQKARAWFRTAPVQTTEDHATRLLGLFWSAESVDTRAAAAKALLALQHADGGWGAGARTPSTALATGQALYSLRVAAGLAADDPAVQKATRYLLRTQDENGTWYMNKTVPPFNYFFDTGFPGGESQYISFAATGWATLALMEVADRPKVARR